MRYKCGKHPLALAGWRCDACGATLCPQCTGTRVASGTQLEVCMPCGGFARPLLVHRGEVEPFGAGSLLRALRWPLDRVGLTSVAAWAGGLLLLGSFGARPAALGLGLLLAYLFQVVRHSARGHDDLPGPEDFHNYLDDVVGPSLRLAAALVWIWAPALAWSLAHRAPLAEVEAAQQREVARALAPGGAGLRMRGVKVIGTGNGLEVIEADAPPPEASREQLQREQGRERAPAAARPADPAPSAAAGPAGADEPDGEDEAGSAPGSAPADDDDRAAPPRAAPPARPDPLRWVPRLLVLLGVLLAPMSLLASALKTPLSVAANPLVLAGHAARLGRDYLALVLFCAAAAAGWMVLRLAGAAAPGLAAAVAIKLAQVFLAFAAFRAIGLLVRARGDQLGYGSDDAYLVPALAGAVPAHQVGERARELAAAAGAASGADAGTGADVDTAVDTDIDTNTGAGAGAGAGAQTPADEFDAAAAASPAAAPPAPAQVAPIELVPGPLLLPGETPLQALARLLARKDLDGCVRLLAESGSALAHPAAAPDTWLWLARGALDRGQPRPAALALRRCLEAGPEGPLAPAAFLLAARVYDEQLADRATSNRLLTELVRRFPDSREGGFAARRLAQLAAASAPSR